MNFERDAHTSSVTTATGNKVNNIKNISSNFESLKEA